MIGVLIRNPPDKVGQQAWQEFLQLLTTLALFGHPLRILVLDSAGDCFAAGEPQGALVLETLMEMQPDVRFESPAPSSGQASLARRDLAGLLHQCQHCMEF